MRVVVCGPNLRVTHGKTFEVHVEGCLDLRRCELRGAEKSTVDVQNRVEVCDSVYSPSDFGCKSGEYVYDFHFAPCLDNLP